VVGLQFGESPSGETRLFSLGADGRLLEYLLADCTAGGGLQLLGLHEVSKPGGGPPTALCFAPPMPYYSHSSTETLLLAAGE
jgi:hypothetical protein